MNRQKQTRLTRCRTGCMRCRVRRRKCMFFWICARFKANGNSGDEGKPRCRNCIDRNFQCQYGPQLTFLAKNAHTVQALEVQTQSASYDAIQVGFPVTIAWQRPDPYIYIFIYSSSLKRPPKTAIKLKIICWTKHRLTLMRLHNNSKLTIAHLPMPDTKTRHSGRNLPPILRIMRIIESSMTRMNRRLRGYWLLG